MMFQDLRFNILLILNKMDKGESLHVELREALTIVAKHRYLELPAKQFNLSRKQDKLDLVILANSFVTTPMITKSTLKMRGWTDKLIAKYLSSADEVTRNPHYKNSAPMRLYALTRVEVLEEQEEVQIALEKVSNQREARSLGALKGIETKREKLLEWVGSLEISIPKYEIGQLLRKAVQHYNWFHSESRTIKHATNKDSSEFLARITNNFLRHECTSYEQELDKLFGKVGCEDAYQELREKINKAIDQTYPFFESRILNWQTQNLNKKGAKSNKVNNLTPVE